MNPYANRVRTSTGAIALGLCILTGGLRGQDQSAEIWARVTGENCTVRCFAGNLSPAYEGTLAQGTVVRVGEEVGEYRRIMLPLGVPGYVSKRFTSEPVDGKVKTTGKMVSFRYRPTPKNRAEAPVQMLPNGTELHFLGEVGDWWKVRFVTESAYVPIKDIAVIETVDASARKNHASLVSAHEAAWRKAVTAYESSKKEAIARARRAETLKDLRTRFQAETGKKLATQELRPLFEETAKLIAELPAEDPLLPQARLLRDAVERQQVFVDAAIVVSKKPKPGKPKIKITPPVKDRLGEKLDTIGWLTYHPGSGGPAAYRLEKGGRVIAFLYCNSLRYDLSMFDGVEIGVRGTRRQDARTPYLDVEHIQVLSAK